MNLVPTLRLMSNQSKKQMTFLAVWNREEQRDDDDDDVGERERLRR